MSTTKYRHYCKSWDNEVIDETDMEILSCECFDPEPANLTAIKAEYAKEVSRWAEEGGPEPPQK